MGLLGTGIVLATPVPVLIGFLLFIDALWSVFKNLSLFDMGIGTRSVSTGTQGLSIDTHHLSTGTRHVSKPFCQIKSVSNH